ncbi:MAG: proton-conducting transporter membrane subunit [Ignavibacteriales bacterium]|nr:proton-conducting transporter membrane subunit [Ignavibacteriales bacterium]
MLENELAILVYIPFGIAVLNIFLPVIVRKVLTFLTILFSFVIVHKLYTSPAENLILFNNVVFAADQMSLFVLIFIQLLSIIILIFSLKGISKAIEKRFFILYPLTLAFCNGTVVSQNSISFLIFWGLSGLALYMFALLGKTQEAPSTAKKTFIIVGGSDAFLIMGLVIMWFLKPETGWMLKNFQLPLTGELSYIAFFFLLVASFAKAGGFPLHTWVPDFSKDAPIESVALLPSSLDKLLGIYLLARMVTSLFIVDILINMLLISLGAITVITAVMMAMNQHNGRKLLGYHAVSQVGYMIMGVGSGSVLAFAGGLFHMINNTIYKSNLFLSLGSVEKQTGTNDLDNLGGLGKKMPATFVMALVGALSISGIPPFNGFFSKWMIYQGLLEKTRDLSPGYQIWLLICLILAVFGSALTLASFMKFLHAIYLGKRPQIYDNIKEAPANQWIATGLLSFLCLLFGIFAIQIPLNKFIYPVLLDSQLPLPQFIGLYNPQIIFILFGIAFIVGLIIYLSTSKVRYDEVYLGGMSPSEKFRISGTAFYNEIRNMIPIRYIYNWAEKKYFDLYSIGSKSTFAFSDVFQKAHPGQLQLYILYLTLGFLIFILFI